jgi:hypothetical protein
MFFIKEELNIVLPKKEAVSKVTPCCSVSSLRTWWLIFYHRDNKEGTEITETKYYFESF